MSGAEVLLHATTVSLVVLTAAMGLAVVRLVRGPSLADRILALDLITTLAIGYMALARSERAQLCLARDGLMPGPPPSRGRAGLGGFLRSIESAEAGGKTDLARAIGDLVKRAARPGLLVVTSDFFDPGPVLTAAARAIMAGHELVLLQLVSPEDIEPELDGDLALVDVETGAIVEVTVDGAALAAYALRFAGLCEELRAFARRHHATYVRARTDEALEPVVRRVVARSID